MADGLSVNENQNHLDNNRDDDEDDLPQLSAHALAALQEFYKEDKQKQEKEASKGNTDIDENWQLSQFWYNDKTALTLAEEALRAASSNGRIACLCAPTLYKKLLEIKPAGCEAKIFEFDRRFNVFGEDFVFYDYNKPLDLPDSITECSFDVVFADPPFLSEECLTKTAQTMKYLTKERIILCTGQVMEELAYKLLGLTPCKFKPIHSRNLSNPFSCFVNYDSELNK